jgi:murein DD-endopeptidase MepM/ murein hydrolase activator NlpD
LNRRGTLPHRPTLAVLLALTIGTMLPACAAGPPAGQQSRASDIHLPLDRVVFEDRVPLRGTLDGLLRAHRIGADAAQLVVAAARTAFNPRALRAGQPYKIVMSLGGLFRSFEYGIDDDRFLRVAGPGGGEPEALKAEILMYPKSRLTAAMSGHIDAGHPSLVAAVGRAGERVDLALRLAEIFSGQLDFNGDLQPDDRVEALFEKDFREGEFSGYGSVLAAVIVNNGRRLQAFRFVDGDGPAGYYDETGHSVRRSFLRSPLPFTPRVTSGFSMRRMHPVYGVGRAHLGVDYAAPTGTPVLAVADGVVVSAGFSGASGRLVRLRHANSYQTYYLHLSAIASGIRPGARVAQGDVIGRVGASGVVTGPHLDYRLTKRGVFVNPLVEQRNMPPGDPVSAGSLAAFEAARDDALRQLTEHFGAPAPLPAENPGPADSPPAL